jgi:predicted  nucleic acid-binding Zn-ribbon protein
MDIAAQLVLLAELAHVDQQAKGSADRLESVPADAKRASALADTLQKNLEKAQNEKTSAEQQRRAVEIEIQDEKSKMKKWEARADQIRGEREHAALSSEIGTSKRVISKLEDRALELMQAMEDADKGVATATAKHAAQAESARAEWKKVEGDVKALEAELATFQVARSALLQKLPAPLVKRYEMVAAKRQGVGVAIIRVETCGSCKRTLPPQLCIQVRRGQVLEQCPSCSRILVHEDMTRAAPQTTPDTQEVA